MSELANSSPKRRMSPRTYLLSIGLALAFMSAPDERVALAQTQPENTADCPETNAFAYSLCAKPLASELQTQEKITKAVGSGRPALLDKNSIVSGCFLRSILTKPSPAPLGVIIQGATIKGALDLRNEEIAVHVEFINCNFEDDVNLKRTHFKKGLTFKGSTFSSGCRLDAEDAIVDSDFVLDESVFKNCLVFLKSMKVGVDFSVVQANFSGMLNLTGTAVGGSFFATDTQFAKVDLDIKVAMDADLSGATFNGPAHFGSSDFHSLDIQNTTFNADVNLKSAKIGDFYLGKDPAARFKGARLIIEDMTFQYMSPEDWNELKKFAEKSNTDASQRNQIVGDKSNSAQFYTSLEKLFQQHGHSDDADQIYIAWKLRERTDPSMSWIHRVESSLEYWLVGYGRQKEYLLVWCLPFIGLGFIFFQRDFMELRNLDDAARYQNKYCLFLYTLDLFVPIISLGYKDTWTPKTLGSRIYKPIHIIIGNLLVPIGLAAWVGLIK